MQIPSYSKHDNFKLMDARNAKVITLWHPGNTLFLGQRAGMEERQTATVRYKFYIQETEAIINEEWGKISYAYA
jgi:hypothetical protein